MILDEIKHRIETRTLHKTPVYPFIVGVLTGGFIYNGQCIFGFVYATLGFLLYVMADMAAELSKREEKDEEDENDDN